MTTAEERAQAREVCERVRAAERDTIIGLLVDAGLSDESVGQIMNHVSAHGVQDGTIVALDLADEREDLEAVRQRIAGGMDEAISKALDALARYKFEMFGYHAAAWVKLNALLTNRQPNPFRPLVHKAREMIGGLAEAGTAPEGAPRCEICGVSVVNIGPEGTGFPKDGRFVCFDCAFAVDEATTAEAVERRAGA